MVAERVTKKAPRLALIPRDQVREVAIAADHREPAATPRRKKQANPAAQTRHGHARHKTYSLNDKVPCGDTPDDGDDEDEAGGFGHKSRQEHQLRLGERFLRMMALMTRLSRLQLDAHDVEPPLSASPQQQSLSLSSSPTVLEKIIHTKEERHVHPQKRSPLHKSALPSSSSPPKGAAAPLIVPVNPATEPLRPHLTFEISMLLPAPMDTRQSSLQSPIRRKQLRPRRRKRRRRRRRVPRTWETSHATWAPRASADYIHELAEQNFLARSSSSKLMEKFAQLKQARESSSMAKSASMPALNHNKKYLYAFPNEHKSSSKALQPRHVMIQEHDDDADSEDEDDDEWRAGDSEENDDLDDAVANEFKYEHQHEQHFAEPGNNEPPFSSLRPLPTDAASHTYPNEVPRTHSSSITQEIDARQARDEAERDQSTASSSKAAPQLMSQSPTRKRPMYHQPAWISPELKAWLIGSGMFQTKPRHAIR